MTGFLRLATCVQATIAAVSSVSRDPYRYVRRSSPSDLEVLGGRMLVAAGHALDLLPRLFRARPPAVRPYRALELPDGSQPTDWRFYSTRSERDLNCRNFGGSCQPESFTCRLPGVAWHFLVLAAVSWQPVGRYRHFIEWNCNRRLRLPKGAGTGDQCSTQPCS